jgi:pimeloyl-ACP methyl ester carboxylesterase
MGSGGRLETPSGAISYEEVGSGPPLVCLHGGWGERAMPFDEARRLAGQYRVVVPSRIGYGRSTPLERLAIDYHALEAERLSEFLSALGLARPILWGHSDGAVIAALFAAAHPDRPAAIVLEAIHFHRAKSRSFFATYAESPESVPESARARLRLDHGDRWPDVIRMHSRVWLEYHEHGGDFYGERLARIRCPALILHGDRDPHTPVAEAAEVARRIPNAELAVVAGGAHSPHSESAVARACVDRVAEFLRRNGLECP